LLLSATDVDDLIITGGDHKELEQFKEEMKATFQMSDLRLLKYYLGLEVNQTPGGITVSQSAYAVKILEVTSMVNCNSSQTPMEPHIKLSKASTTAPVDTIEYREIIGSLSHSGTLSIHDPASLS
jgi:hypothetical protein